MCKKERPSGHGAGPVTIGSIVVPARWRYRCVEGLKLAGQEEFKLVVTLRATDRKKLVNLKKGDWTTVTADSFCEVPVYLSDIDYEDAASRVSLIFIKTRLPSSNGKS
jgi:hypothetical protein